MRELEGCRACALLADRRLARIGGSLSPMGGGLGELSSESSAENTLRARILEATPIGER